MTAAGRMIERLKKRRDYLAAARGTRAHRRAFVLEAVRRGDDGPARLGFTVSKRAAKRLGVSRRALASGKVTCVAGKAVSYRVKPSRKVRKALKAERPKALRLTLRLSLPGGDAVQRKLTVRR